MKSPSNSAATRTKDTQSQTDYGLKGLRRRLKLLQMLSQPALSIRRECLFAFQYIFPPFRFCCEMPNLFADLGENQFSVLDGGISFAELQLRISPRKLELCVEAFGMFRRYRASNLAWVHCQGTWKYGFPGSERSLRSKLPELPMQLIPRTIFDSVDAQEVRFLRPQIWQFVILFAVIEHSSEWVECARNWRYLWYVGRADLRWRCGSRLCSDWDRRWGWVLGR